MKKTFSLFSLLMLLVSNFLPLVSYANDAEMADPVNTPAEEPVSEPTTDQDDQSTADPVNTPAEEPVSEPTTDQDNQPTADPVNTPTEEPVSEPATNQDEQTTVETEVNTVVEPVSSRNTVPRALSSYNGCYEVEWTSIIRFNYEVEGCFEGKVEIPSSIKRIEDNAWPYTVGKTDEEKAVNEEIDLIKSGITQVVLPDDFLYIWQGAFQKTVNMTNINFPNTLQWIWAWAFQGAWITSADVSMIDVIENWVFNSTENLTNITFSDNLRSIWDNAFQKSAAEMVINSEKIEYVWSWAFADSNLKYINLKNLTSISQWAFAWTKLSGVEFNDNLTTIGDMAFQNLKSETCNIEKYSTYLTTSFLMN